MKEYLEPGIEMRAVSKKPPGGTLAALSPNRPRKGLPVMTDGLGATGASRRKNRNAPFTATRRRVESRTLVDAVVVVIASRVDHEVQRLSFRELLNGFGVVALIQKEQVAVEPGKRGSAHTTWHFAA